jgi:hypothetical protein
VTGSFLRHLHIRAAALCAVLACGLAGWGCGGDDGGSTAPAEDQEIVEAASKEIEQAAGRIANSTRDRNLPGPYVFKVVCLSPEEAAQFRTPRESVQCHVEAFTENNAYVWSEDWRVPIVDGKPAGEPEIVGEYRIRNYLRRDHRLNCSGGKTPQERCTGDFRQPEGGATGVPGGAPPTVQPPGPGTP